MKSETPSQNFETPFRGAETPPLRVKILSLSVKCLKIIIITRSFRMTVISIPFFRECLPQKMRNFAPVLIKKRIKRIR
jgi:hypothetical protein